MYKKIMSCYLSALLLFLCIMPLSAADEYVKGDIVISEPWARAMPGGAKVGSGFMDIRNKGQDADRLIAVDADIATRIEIHSMEMDGDVMKMREVENGLEIPAHGSITLKPGGYHLMFFNPQSPFKQDEHFQVKLVFERAGRVAVRFDIKALDTQNSKSDHTNDHANSHDHAH